MAGCRSAIGACQQGALCAPSAVLAGEVAVLAVVVTCSALWASPLLSEP